MEISEDILSRIKLLQKKYSAMFGYASQIQIIIHPIQVLYPIVSTCYKRKFIKTVQIKFQKYGSRLKLKRASRPGYYT